MITILDIDGTLSDFSHRQNIVDKDEPTIEDWKTFTSPTLVLRDTPMPYSVECVAKLIVESSSVHFVTGRNERLRSVTLLWISNYFPLHKENINLYMRPNGELSTGTEHKERILNQKILPYVPYASESLVSFDDDLYVLGMYKNYGLAFKAPECWKLMCSCPPKAKEPLFTK